MPRQPINVLVFPYFITDKDEIEYAVFKRADADWWQGIAGGVEEGESVITAAKRECWEETRIDSNNSFIKLDSISSIPSTVFNCGWDSEIYVVKEYCYGVEVKDKKIVLSNEHQQFGWFTYEEALELLKWDSNKTALWELNKRLNDKKIWK